MNDTNSIVNVVALKVLPRYNLDMQNERKGDIELGKRIKAARGEMTQEELAEESGVSLSMIQKMEAGRLFGGKITHYKLAKTLGVTESYLVYGTLPPEKTKSRIPDMPPDEPLTPEELAALNDPRLGGVFYSREGLSRLSNRMLRQIALDALSLLKDIEDNEQNDQ